MNNNSKDREVEQVYKMLREMTKLYQKSQGRLSGMEDEQEEEQIKIA